MFSFASLFSRLLPARTSISLVASVALVGSLLPASSAAAAPLNTGACSAAALSQPFARWGDSNDYELVSQGNFEGSASEWQLAGGAHVVAEGEPYVVAGAVGHHSLALPAGATVQSPFTCVTAAYPSFRFFTRQRGLLATLLVTVVYRTALGQLTASLGAALLSGTWQPTLPMLTDSIVGGVLSGGVGQVALRFTALLGESRIDDVYLDPRMR